MASTAAYLHGTFVITTSGDGVCRFTPSVQTTVVAYQEWTFDAMKLGRLYVQSTNGTYTHFEPRTVTIPAVGTVTILAATTNP